MDSSDLVQTTSHENPDFRLTRLILIDSYARGRTVEIDLAGHTSLTGENASGKTTLLRLFPLFFGEAPSKVITTDENNFKFAKHYFPTQASYVIFEYERRGARVLSVIHPEGQSDSVCYRFIDSPYRPELFRDGLGLIQSSELTRHLTKLGVEHTRPLSLTLYRQILQNEAGREYRQLASRFAFTGSGGRLKHIERIVSSILLRATSFYDLKRMIVSSVQESTEAFSLRTNKRELTQWIAEYEAHNAVMGKASIMEELELADQQRRHAVDEFATLHASFQLIHDHYQGEIRAGEAEEDRLRSLRNQKLSDYSNQSIALMEQVNAETAKINSIDGTIRALDTHKRQYDTEKAEERAAMVDGLPGMQTRLTGQQSRLAELEASSKSVVEVFDKLDLDARADADQNTRQLETRKTGLVQGFAAKQAEMFGRHAEQQKAVTARQRTELASLNANAATIGVERARLETVAKHPTPDPEVQQAYDLELEATQEASRRVDTLRVGLEPLERKLDKAGRSFADEEAMLNGSRDALEKAELDLQDIVAAGSAGEETLLGFLRANKPDWAQDIGRLISEETLMRSDLAPAISGGDDLFGVILDLEQLEASRLSSEESIQQEIGRLRALVDKRQKQLDEDQRKLNEAARHRNHAKEARDAHQLQLEQAIAAKAAAEQRMNTARTRWLASKEAARKSAQAALEVCQKAHDAAKAAVSDADKRHAAELSEREQAHAAERVALTSMHEQEIGAIDQAVRGVEQQLHTRLEDISRQRNEALRANGVDTAVLDPIRSEIGELKKKIEKASNDRNYVSAYRTWLEVSWAKRPQHEVERDTAQSAKDTLAAKHSDLTRQRDDDLAAHDRLAKDVVDAIEKATKFLRDAKGQLTNLSAWPQDKATLDAGFDNRISVELLASRRREISGVYAELQKRIEEGVDDIRKQMISSPGSGPERYHANALQRIGHPQPSQAYLWIDGLRGWYQHEHAQNKAHLIQMGKTMAQSISAFWSGLGNFKKQVGNFAADLKAHLHQGQVFANIADVSVIITTDVEKQGYWQAIESLHNEYDSWHVLGDALPPPSFVTAAREVAMVLSDDKGLVADPVDLINLQVTANIDGDGSKVAKNEAALVRMSSNGLSYIILVVIMIGFINRIRRKERVAVPFVVDELKDLSVVNATALLNLLARNNITMISAFPDVDPDLAPLFAKNYKILPGRTLATVKLEAEEDVHA